WIERRRVDDERLHRGQEPLPSRGVEPRPDLAGEPQLPVLVAADRYRPEGARVPLARRPATDDQLLLRPDLDLDPRRRAPPRLVARAAELGHAPLGRACAAPLHERLALAFYVSREADAGRLAQHGAEESLAILQRHVEQRLAVEIQQGANLVEQPPSAQPT